MINGDGFVIIEKSHSSYGLPKGYRAEWIYTMMDMANQLWIAVNVYKDAEPEPDRIYSHCVHVDVSKEIEYLFEKVKEEVKVYDTRSS